MSGECLLSSRPTPGAKALRQPVDTRDQSGLDQTRLVAGHPEGRRGRRIRGPFTSFRSLLGAGRAGSSACGHRRRPAQAQPLQGHPRPARTHRPRSRRGSSHRTTRRPDRRRRIRLGQRTTAAAPRRWRLIVQLEQSPDSRPDARPCRSAASLLAPRGPSVTSPRATTLTWCDSTRPRPPVTWHISPSVTTAGAAHA